MSDKTEHCGGWGIIELLIFGWIGFNAMVSLSHVSAWCKRDGIQRGMAVVKEDGGVEWTPLGKPKSEEK